MEIFQRHNDFVFGFIASEIAVNGIKKTVRGLGGVNSQLVQIYIDYSSLPSMRDITLDEVRFFYEPLIDGLIELQKAKNKKD